MHPCELWVCSSAQAGDKLPVASSEREPVQCWGRTRPGGSFLWAPSGDVWLQVVAASLMEPWLFDPSWKPGNAVPSSPWILSHLEAGHIRNISLPCSCSSCHKCTYYSGILCNKTVILWLREWARRRCIKSGIWLVESLHCALHQLLSSYKIWLCNKMVVSINKIFLN